MPLFLVGGVFYEDHSVIRPDQFGEGYDALHCITPYQQCCKTEDNPGSSMEEGQWITPGFSNVGPINAIQSLYMLNDLGRVSLNRPSNFTPQSGIYQCQIPGADGSVERLYIGLYLEGEGEL